MQFMHTIPHLQIYHAIYAYNSTSTYLQCNLCIKFQIANLQCNLCIHLCIHFHIYKSTLQLMHTIANANHACRLVLICWPVLRTRAAACALDMKHDLFTMSVNVKCRIFSTHFYDIFATKSNVNCQKSTLNAYLHI